LSIRHADTDLTECLRCDAVFLASNKAKFITAEIMDVNRGAIAKV